MYRYNSYYRSYIQKQQLLQFPHVDTTANTGPTDATATINPKDTTGPTETTATTDPTDTTPITDCMDNTAASGYNNYYRSHSLKLILATKGI